MKINSINNNFYTSKTLNAKPVQFKGFQAFDYDEHEYYPEKSRQEKLQENYGTALKLSLLSTRAKNDSEAGLKLATQYLSVFTAFMYDAESEYRNSEYILSEFPWPEESILIDGDGNKITSEKVGQNGLNYITTIRDKDDNITSINKIFEDGSIDSYLYEDGKLAVAQNVATETKKGMHYNAIIDYENNIPRRIFLDYTAHNSGEVTIGAEIGYDEDGMLKQIVKEKFISEDCSSVKECFDYDKDGSLIKYAQNFKSNKDETSTAGEILSYKDGKLIRYTGNLKKLPDGYTVCKNNAFCKDGKWYFNTDERQD